MTIVRKEISSLRIFFTYILFSSIFLTLKVEVISLILKPESVLYLYMDVHYIDGLLY